jgi:hypothetical protein
VIADDLEQRSVAHHPRAQRRKCKAQSLANDQGHQNCADGDGRAAAGNGGHARMSGSVCGHGYNYAHVNIILRCAKVTGAVRRSDARSTCAACMQYFSDGLRALSAAAYVDDMSNLTDDGATLARYVVQADFDCLNYCLLHELQTRYIDFKKVTYAVLTGLNA